ncbi:hypothetical protein K2P56_02455 [Patescibacteria group bacterium]|nr:hypothetical protein [Patescibacteria group bacterium]
MKRGFLTVEVVIALAVFTIIMSSAVLLSFNGQTAGLDTELTKETVYQAQSSSQTDLQLASVATGFNALSSTVNVNAGYTRTVTNSSPCLKITDTSFSTSTEKNRALSAGIVSAVASIQNALALGGGCDPFPPSTEWDNPDSLGSVDVSGADGTGVDAQWFNGHRYAFVTADPSSGGNEDFYVFGVDDPENPTDPAVGELNTGNGLYGIDVAGQYAYVIQNDNEDQLQVIDISDPANPSVAAELTLAGVDGSGSYPEGWSIAYYDERVYIGLRETAGPEFHVIDVSNPQVPVQLGSLEVTHNINDIVVSGNYAYLATSADYGELVIIDISNPASLSLPPNFSTPGTMNMKFNARTHAATPAESTEDGWSVDVAGGIAYLGRARVNGSTERDYYVLDVSTPSSVALLGSLKMGLGPNSEVSDTKVRGRFAYLSTTDSNEPFFVLNIEDSANPVVQSTCGLNFSQVTRGLAYLDNYVFAVNRSNDILRIIYDLPSACTP